MKILFYSTNSNIFDEKTFLITSLPLLQTQWNNFISNHPEHSFTVVTQKPGLFFLDEEDLANKSFEKLNSERPDIIITDTTDNNQIVETIISLKPDIAISMSFWITPYDWLPVQDGIIGEKLKQHGIKVICQSVETSMICFDKYETQKFLIQNHFNYAKGLCVKHDMYFCAGNRKEIKKNIYKDYVLNEIRKLQLPVIIKDTVGLSSYGMQVVHTYGELTNYLNSKRNNSDRIVEEMISGPQFGVEIYGCDGKYTVLDPFMFSVNQYGITSPKQSIKAGPVTSEKYKIDELKKELLRLAELLRFEGVAQVDLVFHDGKWFIIEINPRLSGMTSTYACAKDCSVYELAYNNLIEKKNAEIVSKLNYTLNIKFGLLSEFQLKTMKELYIKDSDGKKLFYVKSICQTEDKNAQQIREKGYCEVILSGFTSKSDLLAALNNLHDTFKEVAEEAFFNAAENLIPLL